MGHRDTYNSLCLQEILWMTFRTMIFKERSWTPEATCCKTLFIGNVQKGQIRGGKISPTISFHASVMRSCLWHQGRRFKINIFRYNSVSFMAHRCFFRTLMMDPAIFMFAFVACVFGVVSRKTVAETDVKKLSSTNCCLLTVLWFYVFCLNLSAPQWVNGWTWCWINIME